MDQRKNQTAQQKHRLMAVNMVRMNHMCSGLDGCGDRFVDDHVAQRSHRNLVGNRIGNLACDRVRSRVGRLVGDRISRAMNLCSGSLGISQNQMCDFLDGH